MSPGSNHETWNKLLSPLLRENLKKLSGGSAAAVGDWHAWGITEEFSHNTSENQPVALLLARLTSSSESEGNKKPLLSIINLSVLPNYDAFSLGRALLEKAYNFAGIFNLVGLHIPTPREGSYSLAIRELISNQDGWIVKPGKVIVRLSKIDQVGCLLQRMENAVARQKQTAEWRIEPYAHNSKKWEERIAFSRDQNFGIPWDPMDENTEWKPADNFSRIVKARGQIIGWLICHYATPNMLRYGKFWVDPGWENSGAPLALLCDVMRSAHFQGEYAGDLTKNCCSPIASGCFISHPTNKRLHRLMTKKFRPVCDSWVELEHWYLYL